MRSMEEVIMAALQKENLEPEDMEVRKLLRKEWDFRGWLPFMNHRYETALERLERRVFGESEGTRELKAIRAVLILRKWRPKHFTEVMIQNVFWVDKAQARWIMYNWGVPFKITAA